jgi:hypothetical protein
LPIKINRVGVRVQKKAGFKNTGLFLHCFGQNQGALMALTGQESTHAAQSMHVSASITRFSPTSLMALTGQVSSQAPQLMHSSEIV